MKNLIKVFSVIVASAFFAMLCCCAAYAEEGKGDVVDVTINGVAYQLPSSTPIDFGKADPGSADIKVIAVNGVAVENVGTKSGVLDDQGRTVLEYNARRGWNGAWTLYLNYHSSDDPVAANRECGFEFPIIKAKSTYKYVAKPVAPAMRSVKAAGLKRAVKVSWAKTTKATGFQVKIAKTKAGLKKAKNCYAGKSCTSKTFKGLKKGQRYYVQVCSYKTAVSPLTGKTVRACSAVKIVCAKAK